ncbi:MAG TPA: hypothetical protein VN174_04815 [Candidatus Methanoperedens sp.]|nr:hypothetical protein [Candidatus Methanoperedens sp.]
MAKNKISLKKIALFLLLTFIAIGVRIIPFPGTEKRDLLVHYDWSKIIYKQGLKDIYFKSDWSYSPPTQPPLMMLSFWTSRHLYENRYILSELHNSIHLPPSSFIIWFDEHGEYLLLRLWAIAGDILSAFLIYFIVKKYLKKQKIALTSFIFMLFNPLSLFETTIWGQNDIISTFFVYLAFVFVSHKSAVVFSPLLFLVGLFVKPTSLVLLPFYVVFLLKNSGVKTSSLQKIFISIILCLGLTFIAFKPFVNEKNNYIKEIKNIVVNRMAPSSKGVSRASNSAFNIYSLIYDLDKTLGSKKILSLSLDSIGLIAFVLINIISIRYLVIHKKQNQSPIHLFFLIFFISEATFLFMTGMLERYFFPAFLASVLLMFLDYKNFGMYIIIQNIIWFLNLFYSYYQREIPWIKDLFEMNYFLLIRLLSLASIINFVLICRIYFKKYFPTKNQY